MSSFVKTEPSLVYGFGLTNFKCDTLCSVSENFLNSPYDNATIQCGDGASVSTSAVLLAAMSPWLKSLMEGTNMSEEFWICLPSISSIDFEKSIRNLTEDSFAAVSTLQILGLLRPAHYETLSGRQIDIMHGKSVNSSNIEKGENQKLDCSIEIQKLPEENDEEDYREAENEEAQQWGFEKSSGQAIEDRSTRNGLKRKRGRPRKEETSGKERKCYDCEEVFFFHSKKDNNDWMNHQRKHEIDKFECTCALEWTSIKEKERHMKVDHLGWLPCEICNDIMSSKLSLEKHLLTHAENFKENEKTRQTEKPTTLLCQDCGKVFKNNSYHDRHKYDNHIAKHKIEKFACDCDVQLNTLVERERHMKVDHLGWFGCEQCLLCFKNKDTQEKHSEMHSLSFICDICGYIGNTKSNLSEHTKRIHETNLVKCPDCDKIFKNDQRLMHHKRKVHMARQCPICGEIFKTLRVHLNTVHKTDSEKKYQCQDCGKGFYDRSKLESHRMSIHIKSRPHRCRYGCDIGYNDVSNRNSHEKKKHGGLFMQIVKIDLE